VALLPENFGKSLAQISVISCFCRMLFILSYCDCGDTCLMCWHQARVNPELFESWFEVLFVKPTKFQLIEFWHYTKFNLALFLKNSFIYH
jgi:hypothetical protein